MEIELSSSSGPLHIILAEQIITGKVIFTNKKERPTGFVTISLLGKTDTAFSKGRTVYIGSATLLNLVTILHDGGSLAQKRYEWPFEFTFPKVTSGEEKKWLDVPPFQVSEGHRLPPSMVFDSGDFDRDSGKGSVVYTLEAKFSTSPKSSVFSSSESASTILYYIPYRQTELPAPRIASMGKERFTCSSKLLGPPGEKPKGFFKRVKTPTSVFEIGLTVPHTLYVGAPLPITLTLTHDLANSTAPEIPVVKLTSCTVTLIRTMHAAGKALLTSDDSTFSIAELLLSSPTLSLPLSETQNLSEILSLPGIRTKYGMSFATYNLAQTFKVMVKVTLECADKSFWTELRSKSVVVLAPFTMEGLEKGGGDPGVVLLGMNGISSGGDGGGEAAAGLLEQVLGVGIGAVLGAL